MSLKRVSPQEARELMEKEGYVYVDVRSIPEFEAGHPQGAYNVPLLHMGPHGMSPNPEFLDVMQRNFAKDEKLVVGCKAGGRSLQAANLLASSGFTNVVDQRAGFEGAGGPGGGSEPGWRPGGLPVSTQAGPGRAYEALHSKPR
jgi:rhodanese-related sulfurtransferase